jgi:hypothetical protein
LRQNVRFDTLDPLSRRLEREERLMVSVLIHHRVADYDSWKRSEVSWWVG